MSEFYTAVIGINLLYLLVMMFIARSNSIFMRSERRAFICTFALLMVVSIAEWAGYTLNNAPPRLIPLHAVVKAIEYSTGPFVAVLLGSSLSRRKPPMWALGLLAVHTLLEAASIWFGFIFYVDAENVYHRASCYPIYVSAYIVSIIYLFAGVAHLDHTYQKRSFHLMLLTSFFLVFCSGIQIVCSSIRVAWMATAMAAGLFFLCYSNLRQQVDSVTNLPNRSCYRASLDDLHDDAVFVLFDLNTFKQVNDRYGHTRGDQCLALFGHLLQEVFSSSGSIYRIGGDEFCAVLHSDANAAALCGVLKKSLLAARTEHPYLPDFSAGWATFDSRGESVLDAIDRADAMMYEQKGKKSIL